MIRTQLMVGYPIYQQLRAMAELDGLGNAENAAELLLAEALSKRPELADLAKRELAAKKQARADWKAAWPALAANDELP